MKNLACAAQEHIGESERLGVLTVCKPAGTVALFQETARRKIIFYGILLGAIVIALGVYPMPVLNLMRVSLNNLIKVVAG